MSDSDEHSLMAPLSALPDAMEYESRRRRYVCFALVGLLAIAFFVVNFRFWAPVHPGVDQNGYLVGGKQLAQTGSMAFRPHRVDANEVDPFQFVGRMWVGVDLGTPNERYYPKYPVGLPLIYAAALKLGGESHGMALVYLISPIAMTLSLIGVHLLTRLLLGSIPAVFVTLLVATSPVTLSLVNNPNSHAVTLFLVIWGMYLAVRWWLVGGIASAAVAGLLIGSAVSIRYSEGLLVLTLGLVALFRLQQQGWRDRRAWTGALAMGFGWALPVALLLCHNRVAMGAWTGYDPTNESTGFAWKYFVENWDTMLRLMYQTGMTLVFPAAVGGLAAGFVWNWRVAAVLASWVAPCLLLYTAYYWAPEGLNIGYTRFFLTIFPALGICAFGLLLWPVAHLREADASHPMRGRLKLGATLALGAITAISVPLGIANIAHSVQSDSVTKRNLQSRAAMVLHEAPAGSVILTDDSAMANHIQMAGDYVIYTPEPFARAALDRLAERDPDEPTGLHPARVAYLRAILEGKQQRDLDAMRDDLIAGAIASGRRVFVFGTLNAGANRMGPGGMGPGGMGGRMGAAATTTATSRPAVSNAWANRRPGGNWRNFDARRWLVTTVYTGTDPVAMPRNQMGRFGMMGAMGRGRTPTTAPNAMWEIQEITPRLPANGATAK